jgi:hypothetical protein
MEKNQTRRGEGNSIGEGERNIIGELPQLRWMELGAIWSGIHHQTGKTETGHLQGTRSLFLLLLEPDDRLTKQKRQW